MIFKEFENKEIERKVIISRNRPYAGAKYDYHLMLLGWCPLAGGFWTIIDSYRQGKEIHSAKESIKLSKELIKL